jgi:oxygen-dependent protoporphyrinogen oxidase
VNRRAVVVGGGITGLTAAYRLRQRGIDVTVLEEADRPGGKIRGVRVAGMKLPAGADSFIARKPGAVELCREMGLERRFVKPGATGAYLWTDRGLVEFQKDAAFGIPGDVAEVFHWPGLSKAGRRRAAQDLVRRKHLQNDDQSLGALLRRRLGDEATDNAVAPLLGGLHAGDVDKMSLRATFPELERWESYQGSLIRGSQAARRNARRTDPGPMFLSLEGGLETMTSALSDRLPGCIRTGTSAVRVDAGEVRSSRGERLEADAVIVATPGFVSAAILEDVAPVAAADLAQIHYVTTGVVFLVYPQGTAEAIPQGSGFVVPRGKAPMTACTWLSRKWPEESYGDRAVVRCFTGAAGEEDVVDEPDGDLVEACARHLAAVLDLPPQAESSAVHRWRRAMPQFEVGHLERVERIRASLPEGIFVVGQATDGVGIPDCISAAERVAEEVAVSLGAVEKETV